MTEKRKYEKPSTRVIELKQRARLLAGSLLTGRRDNVYGTPEDIVEWED